MQKLKDKLGRFFRLVMFIIFTIVWSFFVYVIDGEWLYFIPLFVADALFWKTFNYTFWKKRVKQKKKKKKSELRNWFDAILFAVIAATILRTFLIEAYTIPTSSMEKSLLIGDFLFVSKVSYGPRVPMTPLAFPLVHHTMPIVGGKSYSESIKLPYHRMKGLGEVKRNDCVVFNWPAETLGRPIDKKENYIKRCVGLPGDEIEVVEGDLMVNGEPQEKLEGMKKQFHYNVETKGSGLNPKILYEKYDITEGGYGRNQNEYMLTLTNENKDVLATFPNVKTIERSVKQETSETLDDLMEWCVNKKWEGRLEVFYYAGQSNALIKDDKYAIIGGLNWLSDNGSLNTDELSWIISNRDFIIQERDKIVMGRQE